MSIGVVLTTFNRITKTLESLEALHASANKAGVELVLYVADAGSDGTGVEIQRRYPSNVMSVPSHVHWNKGMAFAFAKAVDADHELILWLNDDTVLFPDALSRLMSVRHDLRERHQDSLLIIGSIVDPHTGDQTYGGYVRANRYSLMNRLLPISSHVQYATTMNGNCVLITRSAISRIGLMDPTYSHGQGDIDYGLCATEKGTPLVVAPGVYGTCSQNSIAGTWEDPSVPVRRRLQLICEPKGIPPKELLHFTRKHCGLAWPYFFARPYLGILWSSLLYSLTTLSRWGEWRREACKSIARFR